jgi:hypothetical protein
VTLMKQKIMNSENVVPRRVSVCAMAIFAGTETGGVGNAERSRRPFEKEKNASLKEMER